MRGADLQADRLIHVLVRRLRSADQLERRRVVGQHLGEGDGDPVDRLPGTNLDGEQSQLAARIALAIPTDRVSRSRLLRVVEQRVELARGIDEGPDLIVATRGHCVNLNEAENAPASGVLPNSVDCGTRATAAASLPLPSGGGSGSVSKSSRIASPRALPP